MEVLEIAYHRNGVSGEGFWVARIRHEGTIKIAIVPDWAVRTNHPAQVSPDGCYPCYVIDPAKAAGEDGTIAFGPNSWRGDHFFDTVVTAARAGS